MTKHAKYGPRDLRRLPMRTFRNSISLFRHTFGEKNYFLLLSIVVGIVAGLAAVILKTLADTLHVLTDTLCAGGWSAWVIPAVPALGILFCILFVKFWVRGPYDKSLAGVISSLSNGTANVPAQKTYSHILTSGICVGLGASAGLEAPIALTGSAIGSNFARWLLLGREGRTLLLACGGAAGIAAVFNCPVAGTLFACEILLPEFSIPALIPLLIASASAAVVSEVLYSKEIFTMSVTGWSIQNIPFYILLGIAAGLVSSFVIRTSLALSKKFEPLRNVWLKGLLGAAILYLTFLLFPALRGEGYIFVNDLLRGAETHLTEASPLHFLFTNPWSFLTLVGFLIFAKAAISATSIESGGDGGIFAPSMCIGAFTGFFLARFIRMSGFFGHEAVNETNFIAVGMGGVLAGVMHAPMTGIFLIAEITGGYKLFIPLMIVASISCYICRKLSRYNVYKSMIALHGGTPEPSKEVAVMKGMSVEAVVETDFIPIHESDSLRALLDSVMKAKRNLFPVIDKEGRLVGVVTLDDIRSVLLDEQLYDVALVYDLMHATGPILEASDSLADATRLFDTCRCGRIPVVRDGKYLGFVSKAGVFDRYRATLQKKAELF